MTQTNFVQQTCLSCALEGEIKLYRARISDDCSPDIRDKVVAWALVELARKIRWDHEAGKHRTSDAEVLREM